MKSSTHMLSQKSFNKVFHSNEHKYVKSNKIINKLFAFKGNNFLLKHLCVKPILRVFQKFAR